ncbi:hypothetical protein M8Z33_07375 [Streptomyces sp. ZAF1911]|uniref:hypothetical protein n=1 Tax=Streptomyces sp. ZAF1911 TaxID=2944129 RepID=UPI00237A3527|nr:hypothetical protein [Streptomyces sp. ZAF1911]MDD9376494.1 hypothetical protein [Streptomyces sp. ZAF1911]
MRRHVAVVLGQLSLDDVPQATGYTLTAEQRLRAAELRARARRRAAREFDRHVFAFFRGEQP